MPSLTMVALRTSLPEHELFVKLVSRGRHGEIPYYFSVAEHNWEEGTVIFTRLDCAPAPRFKVGMAKNCLVVNEPDQHEVESWLKEWGIPFRVTIRKEVDSPETARQFLKGLRDFVPDSARKKVAPKVQKAIAELQEKEEEDFLAAVADL